MLEDVTTVKRIIHNTCVHADKHCIFKREIHIDCSHFNHSNVHTEKNAIPHVKQYEICKIMSKRKPSYPWSEILVYNVNTTSYRLYSEVGLADYTEKYAVW